MRRLFGLLPGFHQKASAVCGSVTRKEMLQRLVCATDTNGEIFEISLLEVGAYCHVIMVSTEAGIVLSVS